MAVTRRVRAGRCVFDEVVEEIREQLHHETGVDEHRWQIVRQPQLHRMIRRAAPAGARAQRRPDRRSDSHARRSVGAPDSKRVRSSTLEMSSDISRARVSMRPRERARACASSSAVAVFARACCRRPPSPPAACAGRARSTPAGYCADSRSARRRAPLRPAMTAARARARARSGRRRFRADAAARAAAPGGGCAAAPPARLTSAASRRAADRARARRASVSESESGAAPVIEHPLRNGEIAAAIRAPRRAARRGACSLPA